MKAYTALDLMNMDKNSLISIKRELNKALNISPEDREFLKDVYQIANASQCSIDLRKIVGFKADTASFNKAIDSLYDEAIKIVDQAIIGLTPEQMTTWKSLNNVIEGNLRHN